MTIKNNFEIQKEKMCTDAKMEITFRQFILGLFPLANLVVNPHWTISIIVL